jgi:hypothetical protein
LSGLPPGLPASSFKIVGFGRRDITKVSVNCDGFCELAKEKPRWFAGLV